MKNLFTKPFFLGATMVAALSALISIAPVSADRDAWVWSDKSAVLSARAGLSYSMIAERQGSWLLSDGAHLVRFDGVSATDLTSAARDHGADAIKLLASDGREWLVWTKGLADRRGTLWLVDGSTWTDITNVLPTSVETLEAEGHDGQWYFNVTANGVTRLVFLNGTTSVPQDVTLPLEATKAGKAAFVNGRWFWFGAQAGRAMVWSIDGLAMTPVKNVPATSPVSAVWTSDVSALVLTGTNGLYAFDGSSWTDLSGQATTLGLLPATDGLKAAFGGSSWMIVSGANLYRYDGHALASKDARANRIDALAGGNGFAVASTAAGDATLSIVEDNVAETQTAPAPVSTSNASAIANAVSGTDLRVEGIPSDFKVGNGMGFTFHASASDIAGIDRVEIYANGARVRICTGDDCVFNATYWTNGQASRSVTFQAKAWNRLGASTESRIVTLLIDRDSNAGLSAVPDTTTLATDAATGISYASRTVPAGSSLPSGATASYLVSAQDKIDGLASIEIWLNGANAKTCTLGGITAQTQCELVLNADGFPVGTDLFMNARIRDAKGNAVWIPATTLTRPAPAPVASTGSTGTTTPAPVVTPVVSAAPVFAARLVTTPDTSDVTRGSTLTARVYAQDNLIGLDRVEISYGGQIRQICRYGIAMSEVKCDLTIDTATLADNTSLTFTARAINTNGLEAWTNSRTVNVRAANWSPTPAGASETTDGITQWSWLTPPTALLEATQQTTYQVGAWSASGIAKIEMIVNGAVRKTCGFVSGTAARDCAYTVNTTDWNHGQVVTVNARITDMNGHVAWTSGDSVTISRGWWEPLNSPGPYVTVSATKNDSYASGDTLAFTMSGWSPNGVDRLELYLNGSRVATCPSDICRFTSASLTTDHVEYQARLVDVQGKETWTEVKGLNKN